MFFSSFCSNWRNITINLRAPNQYGSRRGREAGGKGSWETYPVEKAFDNRGPGIGSLLLIFHYRARRGGRRARARDVFNDRFGHYGPR